MLILYGTYLWTVEREAGIVSPINVGQSLSWALAWPTLFRYIEFEEAI